VREPGKNKVIEVSRKQAMSVGRTHHAIAPFVGAFLLYGAAAVQAQPSPQGAPQEDTLEEVRVTTQRNSRATEMRRQSSAAKIVVDREELETLDASSVGELLRKLPGTGIFTDPESRGGRGKGRDRRMPQILVDGQPLPGGDRSSGTALRLPVELIERVEIIRNATPEFPSAGEGGTINLVLRDVPPTATGNARIAIGQVGDDTGIRLEGQHGDRIGEAAYLLGLSVQQQPQHQDHRRETVRYTAGQPSQHGFEQIDESGRDDNLALTSRLQWSGERGRSLILSSFVNLTDANRGGRLQRSSYTDPVSPAGLVPDGFDEEDEDTRRQSARVQAEWRQQVPGEGQWQARLTLQGEAENKRKQVDQHDAGATLLQQQRTDEERQEREVGAQVRHKRALGEAHLLTGAIELKAKRSTDRRDRALGGVAQALGADARADIAERRTIAWVQDEWQLADDHVLTPGLRWQALHSTVTDAAGGELRQSHQSVEPSLHHLWQVTPAWNVRSSIALASRPVGARDLSPVVRTANGSNSLTNPDKAGNPNLRPERSTTLDFGVEHFLPERRGLIGASVFVRRVERQVQRLSSFEGGRWVERPYNVGDARVHGVLLDAKWRLEALDLPDTTLRGNASFSQTRLSQAQRDLGAGEGPRRSLNLGVDHGFATLPMEVGVHLNYIGALDRERSARVQQTQGARRTLDLSATWRLDRQSRIKLSLQNVQQAVRESSALEYDGSGQLVKRERDRDESVASAWLAFETKW